MSVPVRQLEGRPHYVVPTVMIVAGVHAGSEGPVLYTADCLAQSVPLWNGKPIIVYHAGLYGNSAAADPSVFNKQKVGTLFNTRWDGHRLWAESWIDTERVGQVDERVLEAIRTGRTLEVSTGMAIAFDDGQPAEVGERAALQLFPDHLAILPDKRGACSVLDGAGLFCGGSRAPALV
jgi:hypothetical protein